MIITTSMMVSKGAVTFQTNILDSLGGSLDTSNIVAVTAAANAGLDLMWIARKFLDSDKYNTLNTSVNGANEAYNSVVSTALQVYGTAVSIPLYGAPSIKDGSIQAGQTIADTTKAVAFSAAFAGEEQV